MPADDAKRRLLITAGPTYEPIDAVRFIGNRSSGRLGSSLADHAADADWCVTLLLGPNAILPSDPRVKVVRFHSCRDLEAALDEQLPIHDTLVMAAAVADYRPATEEINLQGKRRRTAGDLSIHLESTPDLLAGCSQQARGNQLLVGFALEPRERLMESARRKLKKKNIDLIVANALETMDSDTIEATLLGNPDRGLETELRTPGEITKADFADWLLGQLGPLTDRRKAVMTESTTNG